jgi:vacuolar-type H+-ATPase subunit I/STV1
MARKRASAGPEVSLFPFLSILACLIGALTILIVALSASEILQGRKDEAVALAEDYVALEKEIAGREAEIARKEEELRRTNATVVELREIQPRIDEVKAELEALNTVAPELAPLLRQMEEIGKERDRIEDERKKVEADLIEGRERLGELARQAGKGMPLKILSTSDYFRRVAPVFVEARKEGLVIHSPSQRVQVPRAVIGSNPKFRQAVQYVAAKENRIIVFLVREDARSSFYQARDFARGNGAVTSKVPLLGGGDLSLTEFFSKRR